MFWLALFCVFVCQAQTTKNDTAQEQLDTFVISEPCEEVFVSPEGKDGDLCGAESEPCGSVSHALAKLPEGGIVWLFEGLHEQNEFFTCEDYTYQIRSTAGRKKTKFYKYLNRMQLTVGAGCTLTINKVTFGYFEEPVLFVADGGTLIIEDSRFTRINGGAIHSSGDLRISNTNFDHQTNGTIFSFGGSLSLEECYFQKNSFSHEVDGVPQGNGGALHLRQTANVTVNACHMLSNYAGDNGGAFFMSGVQKAKFDDLEFRKNTATNGGAIYSENIFDAARAGEYSHIGCYADKSEDRTLGAAWMKSQSLSPNECYEFCASQGHRYFGLQRGLFCWCGDDSHDKYGPSTCDRTCAGDETKICGGSLAMDVYKIAECQNEDFIDLVGDGCESYYGDKCYDYRFVDTTLPTDACCTCGGGKRQGCQDLEDWTDMFDDGCTSYESQGEGSCNVASDYGVGGVDATHACCHCGGGTPTDVSKEVSAVIIKNSMFEDNHAKQNGGAIRLKSGFFDVARGAFVANTADDCGGAISVDSARLMMSEGILEDNKAGLHGGAFECSFCNFVSTSNCRYQNNHANASGDGIYAEIDDKLEIPLYELTGDDQITSRGFISYNEQLVKPPNPFSFIGCYKDHKYDRVFESYGDASHLMTPAVCHERCNQLWFDYMGLQRGDECWCGNSYDRLGEVPAEDCQRVCTGDVNIKCGGRFVNAVYKIHHRPPSKDTRADFINSFVGPMDSPTPIDQGMQEGPIDAATAVARGLAFALRSFSPTEADVDWSDWYRTKARQYFQLGALDDKLHDQSLLNLGVLHMKKNELGWAKFNLQLMLAAEGDLGALQTYLVGYCEEGLGRTETGATKISEALDMELSIDDRFWLTDPDESQFIGPDFYAPKTSLILAFHILAQQFGHAQAPDPTRFTPEPQVPTALLPTYVDVQYGFASLEDAIEALERDGIVVLQNFLSPIESHALVEWYREAVENGWTEMDPYTKRHEYSSDRVGMLLSGLKRDLVQQITKSSLSVENSYFMAYTRTFDEYERYKRWERPHTNSADQDYTVELQLHSTPLLTWPFYMDSKELDSQSLVDEQVYRSNTPPERAFEANLIDGDAVIYRGRKHTHWRDNIASDLKSISTLQLHFKENK